jgi:DNA-binding SARP family transcriptional activator
MIFRILGSLEVLDDDGNKIVVQGTRARKILATLLLSANRSVSSDRLVAAVWDDRPPATAVKQVRNVVSVLRQVTAEAGGNLVIETDGPGYTLNAGVDELDALAFEAQVGDADQAVAAGSLAEAAARLGVALGLWRGPALSGLSGRFLQAAGHGLNERRTMVAETYYEHQLALGRHHEVAGELAVLVEQHPFRERLVAQLMLALYQCGRQVEALKRYAQVRRRLADELGLDPGPALQRLHQQVLTRDPGLSLPGAGTAVLKADPSADGAADGAGGGPVGSPGRLAPRQLPPPRRHFVGRMPEVGLLDQLAAESESANNVVVAIDGTAGIGKTALALRWAHQVADRFPDGQLYVDLGGYDPTRPPIAPAAAVGGFLDALGVPSHQLPSGFEAQVGHYRSLMAGRRMLVVLDNARDADQLRPLLPGAVGCLALATSRTRMISLAAVEGAHLLTLDPLPAADARQLLVQRLGPRISAPERLLTEVAEECGRLPLALAIAAASAAHKPGRPLEALVEELRAGNLAVLSAGDNASDIRAVFAPSYRALPPAPARLFRLIGAATSADVDLPALARIAGSADEAVRAQVSELVRACLLDEPRPGCYAMHPLLRAYAAELAGAIEAPGDVRAARRRLMNRLPQDGKPTIPAERMLRPA